MLLLLLFFACSPTLQIGFKVEVYVLSFLALLAQLDTCRSPVFIVFSVTYEYVSSHRILLTVHTNNHARYFATFCITSGTYTSIGLVIAWCMFQAIDSITFLTFSP